MRFRPTWSLLVAWLLCATPGLGQQKGELLDGDLPLDHWVLAVLADMGPAAKAAVPALEQAARSGDRDIYIPATEALQKIAPKLSRCGSGPRFTKKKGFAPARNFL